MLALFGVLPWTDVLRARSNCTGIVYPVVVAASPETTGAGAEAAGAVTSLDGELDRLHALSWVDSEVPTVTLVAKCVVL